MEAQGQYRFRMSNSFLAAVNVSSDGSAGGAWYITLPEELATQFPATGQMNWAEIAESGTDIAVVTSWTHFR